MNRKIWTAIGSGALALALVACGGGDDDDASNSGASTAPSNTTPAMATAFDATFGKGGIATLPLNATTNDRFMATAVAPDGKIYAAGFIMDAGDQAFAVARIDAKGALDKTFGTDGVASVNVAVGGKTVELARSVVVQSTGKIVIAGPFEKDPLGSGDAAKDVDVAVVRFDTAGKLDSTFGTNGVAKLDIGPGRATSATAYIADTSWGLANMAGDKLAILGSTPAAGADRTDTDFYVAALTSAGALDTAFGTGGKTVVDGGGMSSDNPRHMIAQSDGKLVTSGYTSIDGVVQPVVLRLNANGALDSTFGKAGIATAKVLAGVTEAYNISQQGSNYILAGYGRGADTAEKVDMVVYRFTSTGAHDTTFGSGGSFRLDIAKDDDRARNVIVLPDDRILAVGSGKKTATDIDGMVVLLSKDGAPVSSFGDGGKIISDLGGPADAWYGVSLTPDKKSVIVAGFKGTDPAGGGNDDAVIARITL